MRRTAFNTFCSLLVLGSYLWGGCISCERFFMQASVEDCCHGKCKHASDESSPERTQPEQAAQACEKIPLVQPRVQDTRAEIAAVLDSAPPQTLASSGPVTSQGGRWQPRPHFDPVSDSQPDRLALNASFLI